jgi:hypothetical protein
LAVSFARMDADSGYTQAWRDYRKRRFVLWTVVLTFIPCIITSVFLIGAPLSALTGIDAYYFVLPILVFWTIMLMVAYLRLQFFCCPRCGKWFFTTFFLWLFLSHRPFARKCVNCDLPKWATSDSQRAEPLARGRGDRAESLFSPGAWARGVV